MIAMMMAKYTSLYCMIYLAVLPNVFTLDLTNCRQEWVVTEFATYAYKVDCSNLGFTRIPSNLPQLTSQLSLNGNSISSVDQSSFDGLTSLHSVDLSGNDIVFLEKGVFEDASDLKILDLSRNKLFCDWRIWWLVSYAKKLETFTGTCFTPRALRGRDIRTLEQTDLAVDCLSVQKLTGASEDGEYAMHVFGHDNSDTQVQIYCHEMNTETPSEFLSLPSGKDLNYVDIKEDETCRYSPELQEVLEFTNKSTGFAYVKIDLTKLQLIANDTTMNRRSQVTFGKPTICDNQMCTNGVASVDLRGTHFQLKETKSAQQVTRCDQKCGFCHHPNYLTLNIVNKKRNPYAACTLPLGMQNGMIPDSEITSSSDLGQHTAPQARLNNRQYFGWCAGVNDKQQELIIHLGKKMTLSGISTQGHKTLPHWVKNYQLLYSEDGKTYKSYEEVGVKKIFDANYDKYSLATHWFRPRFVARFVKIKPLSWNNKICMRIELYGCVNDINSYIIQKVSDSSCLTIGDRVYDKNGNPQFPLVKKSGCQGPDFMFTFHHRRLQHTKSGLCLHLNDQSWFVFNTNCSSTNLMFQKVASKAGESFLIKDTNGYCARISESENNQQNRIFSIWRYCKGGGFTIFKLTREGVASFQPYFQQSKTSVVTDLFKPLTLKCQARAEPIPLYEWSRNGTIQQGRTAISNNVFARSNHVTLVIKNVTWEDRGSYFCNAWNAKGYQYKEYEVIVNPLQWFQTKPIDQRTIHGDTARFDCVSKGIPDPIVSWRTFDESILEYRNVLDIDKNKFSVGKNGSLFVSGARYIDERKYICISDSPGLKANASAKLDVYVTQTFVQTPENQKVLYGSQVVFNCISEGRPQPKISWMLKTNSMTVPVVVDTITTGNQQHEVLGNGSLVVKTALVDDEGEYICISDSPGLKRNSSATLLVYVTQEFTAAPLSKRSLYGHNASFECVSVGVPTPQVSWRRKLNRTHSAPITTTTNTDKYTISDNNTLYINNIDYDDEGNYLCISESPRLTREVEATLDVYVTQRFRIEPQSSKILYGRNYTILCESIGIPAPTVSWAFKQRASNTVTKIADLMRPTITERADGQLLITNAGFDEIGEYFCISESPGLTRNASSHIDVIVTQAFTKHPLSQTVIQGRPTAVFSCVSEGVPKPKTSWKFVSSITGLVKTFDNLLDRRSSVEENNDLVIRDVQNEDEGKYFCISESPRLLVNTSATMVVHVPPVVSITTKNVTVFSSQSTHVTCSAYGDPKPSILWYKMVQNEKTLVTEISDRMLFEDGTLSLNKIEKDDQGSYVCMATNAAGEASEIVAVKVTVRCLMDDIQHGILHPKKYVYGEKELVKIACKKGFQRVGFKELKCKSSGTFNHPFPKCEDIDECDAEPGSGSVDMNVSSPSIDDEPEVCDYNAQCRNTIGSFECICNEGYVMVKNKCEFTPPGSKSQNPGPDGDGGTMVTEPPPQDFSWFERLIEHYQKSIIDEEMFLRKLYDFTRNISTLQHFSWRREALSRVANQALNATVQQDTLGSMLPTSSAKNFLRLHALIVSSLLDSRYKSEWQAVNKKSCGTVCLMKVLEKYAIKITMSTRKGLIVDLELDLDSLNMRLSPVNETFERKDFAVSLMEDVDVGNTAIIPKENYQLIKGSTSIAIRYKTIHSLLPVPNIKEVKDAEILTDVFSLSFTTLEEDQQLVDPAQITFKVKKEDSPSNDQSVCSYWNFKKGKYGGWSTEGCVVSNTSTSTEIVCLCNHLTNFAILVPKKPVNMIHLSLGLAVAVGVGLCIILAFITCLSHVCCSHYVNSDRKAILVNITLTIVLGLIVFVGGIYMSTLKLVPEKYSQYFCFTLVGCLQLFGCAFFAWIFAEAVHLYLSTRIIIDKGNGRLALFYFIGWGVPFAVVAITGVLVYFNKFDLQSRCVMNISLYLVGILVGGPSLLYIIATFIVYIMIRVSLASDKELLNARILFHAKGAMLCSFCLLLLHILVLGSATMFLKFNQQIIYHYIFAALTAAEGLYLVFYHCYVDRRAAQSRSRSNSKKRNSYSTKETVAQHSPNGTSSNTEIAEEAATNEQKYLIKRSSKRSSKGDLKPSPPQIRNIHHQHSSEEALEWDAAYQGMYGGDGDGSGGSNPHSSHETKPLLSGRADTLTEEDGQATPSTFRAGSISKNSTLSRNSTLPKKWKDTMDTVDGNSQYGRPSLKRSNSKASSIVSIETHMSSNPQPGLPVYFPAPPPHYEMSLERNNRNIQQMQQHNTDPYMSSENNSRRGSFGMESDRMSNISSELSNILYELQAFDTNRQPNDPHHQGGVENKTQTSNTLPHRRDPPMTDISQNPMSTFRPSDRAYSKTEVEFEESKPPSYTDHQRVRILRGKSRQETDPADGLHSHAGSMYSSL